MKKFFIFASEIRVKAMLCCGAAALLSACGAGVSDPVNGQQSQAAAVLTSSVEHSAANNAAPMPYGASAANDTALDTAAAAPAATATDASTMTAGAAATPASDATATTAAAAAATTTTADPAAADPAAAGNMEPAAGNTLQATNNAESSGQAEVPAGTAPDNPLASCDTGACQH
jgi:hypothetical protein